MRGVPYSELAREQQPMRAGGCLQLTTNRRFGLTESCIALDRSSPVLPSPLSGFGFHPGEAELPQPVLPIKRPKFIGCSIRKSSGHSLATIGGGSCEKPSPLSRFLRTEKVEEGSGDEITQEYRTSERARSTYEDDATVPEISQQEQDSGNGSWKLRVVASSRCRSPSLVASDVIGTIDFNGDGEFFATGGIARKIRICSFAKMVSEREEMVLSSDEGEESLDDDDEDGSDSDDGDQRRKRRRSMRWSGSSFRDHGYAAVFEICTPGKLSSLKWRPDGSDVIGCADYDGVVAEWSIEHGHTVSERYEHSGQRVWSLDYSKLDPTLSASSSADGTVRVWSRGMESSVAVLRPPSGNSVCSAEFSPAAQHLVAVASADSHVYLHDLRKPNSSLLKLGGHDRAVSYVRFLGNDKLVSASIDSTLKLWDISQSRGLDATGNSQDVNARTADGGAHLVRTFNAHTNHKNFVGLSVHRGAGIFACGSETDEVFVYRSSSARPLLHHKFPTDCTGYSTDSGDFGKSFVGAVCWREQGDNYSLVAANSEGVVQVLQAQPPLHNF